MKKLSISILLLSTLTLCLALAVAVLGGFVGCSKKRAQVSAELEEELSFVTLEVVGQIPSWLEGTLIRNGPVTVHVNGQSNAHWFDGLAMLHAFSFHEGALSYTNRFLRTDAYRTVFEKGSLNYKGFAIDPCRSLFKRFFTRFFHASSPPLNNTNVNVAKFAKESVALTEIPLPVRFDLDTLKTLGVFDYQDGLPKEKCWESAHPHYDGQNKETLNYLVQFGKQSYYTLYRLKEDDSSRHVIAQIPVEMPAYMHSFAMTQNYVIFTEFPFLVKPIDLITKGKAFIKNYSWQPQEGAHFIVINRYNGTLVGRYRTFPFFAFHHINAFEEDDKIYLDIVCYPNANVITNTYLGSVREESLAKVERFSLLLAENRLTSQTLFDSPCEFPRINELFDGRAYRYVYLTDPRLNASFAPLYKLDTITKQFLQWSQEGCYPGEAVFVSLPNGIKEDEGVILAVVFDQPLHRSFLLILDATTFKEIARAWVSHPIRDGLHGQYFRKKNLHT